jgi:hypothetical protein
MSAAVTASVMARRVGCLPDEQTEAFRYPDSRSESGPYEQRQVAPQQIIRWDVQKVWRSSAGSGSRKVVAAGAQLKQRVRGHSRSYRLPDVDLDAVIAYLGAMGGVR